MSYLLYSVCNDEILTHAFAFLFNRNSCDPHPGNLLRTPEGKLCILDWGMVTRLDEDLQVTLSKL